MSVSASQAAAAATGAPDPELANPSDGVAGDVAAAGADPSTAPTGASDAIIEPLPGNGDIAVEAAALAQTDPEMSSILGQSAVPGIPIAGTWNESATKDYYNGTIGLAWQRTLGDYLPTPIASATIPDRNARATTSFRVTGNDFYLLNDGLGTAKFDGRRGPLAWRPTLIVNGTASYQATRNTALLASTVRSVGTDVMLNDHNAMLIAFDQYKPLLGDQAVLQLTAEQEYGPHTLTVYRPNIAFVFPVIDTSASGPPTVVSDFRASAFRTSASVTVKADIVTGFWGGKRSDAISQVFSLPAGNEYYLTVVIKLEKDWPDQGGKLPGLSNTGTSTNIFDRPLTVNGVACDNAGWGGRPANGCRWSARTGWGGRSGNSVGLHTYFYAMKPDYGWGYQQNWPTPAPVGKWFAYVERVRVNTPGQGDGALSYWLCTAAGCAAQFDRQDITWNAADIPEAKINEAWADVYCGELGCPGPGKWKNSTVDLERLTVTSGMPDLTALFGEVNTLNGVR